MELVKGLYDTGAYIKHGIDTYNRQAKVRDLMEHGGIQAVKNAIHSGELVGGAKKGLNFNKRKRLRREKTVKIGNQTVKLNLNIGGSSRQIRTQKPNIARHNPLLQRLAFAMGHTPSAVPDIQAQHSVASAIKRLQEENKPSPALQNLGQIIGNPLKTPNQQQTVLSSVVSSTPIETQTETKQFKEAETSTRKELGRPKGSKSKSKESQEEQFFSREDTGFQGFRE